MAFILAAQRAAVSALGVPLLSGLTAAVWAAALGQGALVGVGAWRLGEWAAAGAERDRRRTVR